ncbi:DUF5045 domain-containing protein [Capnocytophaga canimorsus]|uniref:DUF5045 domain-containing protein n=1 Tax=Capnocytophaga canimorsus TaxID=28188 RepID=UPI001EE00182|nr:DUF5045 domain-containing protein [Capnocytophaga canimorsus]GJQ04031.1 hypothetical protein CAPN009_04460 [Capnocytophaga canimorsus]
MIDIKMKSILLLLFPLSLFSQVSVKDESKINQLKSMEYAQWEFSPDWYYYSWVRRSRSVFGISWSWTEPGLGVHDNGPAGVGGGDGYVNKDKRNIFQYAPMLVFVRDKKDKTEKQGEKTDIVYKQERAKFADKSIDYQYHFYSSSFKNLQNEIIEGTFKYLKNKGNIENVNIIKTELQRINANISIIHKSHLSNSKKRDAYIEYEDELKELKGYVKSLNRINNINKF